MIDTRGIILEIGSQAWLDEEEPRHELGDKVLIGKYSGTIMTGPLDGIKYRMVNARDIYCGIDDGLVVTEKMFEAYHQHAQAEIATAVRKASGAYGSSPRRGY